MVRRRGIERPVAGDLMGQPVQGWRNIELRCARDPFDPGADPELDIRMGRAMGNLDRGVAEEVDAVRPFRDVRLDVQIAGDQMLLAGQVGRHHAQQVPAVSAGLS